MAGIYIHIPFCKSRCAYCDFFSSVYYEDKTPYIRAVCQELTDRKDYLAGQTVETIYFGGGTPSQLSAAHFELIFKTIESSFDYLARSALEVTLEVNPDDITPQYIASIRNLPFNRISLGVQSFNDRELQFLKRRHNAETAINAVKMLRRAKYDNISIDLIYGLPHQKSERWAETLRQACDLKVQHISAYHLTYEEGTPLYKQWKDKIIKPMEDARSVRLFEILKDTLEKKGYEHYEISNFAKEGFRSKHNSSYWNGATYLGVGASAHSYDGRSRRWNPKNCSADYLTHGYEEEIIDERMAYNEFMLTRLRTKEGVALPELSALFGEEKQKDFLLQAQKYIAAKYAIMSDNHLYLTRKGMFISDGIISDFMMG